MCHADKLDRMRVTKQGDKVMKRIKLTEKQINELYDRLIKEKQALGGMAVIETSPRQGINLGGDFYSLRQLVNALNLRTIDKGVEFYI